MTLAGSLMGEKFRERRVRKGYEKGIKRPSRRKRGFPPSRGLERPWTGGNCVDGQKKNTKKPCFPGLRGREGPKKRGNCSQVNWETIFNAGKMFVPKKGGKRKKMRRRGEGSGKKIERGYNKTLLGRDLKKRAYVGRTDTPRSSEETII